MSDSDSFISEVSEEVRRERLYRFLRRYGWIGACIVVVIVGGAAANEWMKARREAAAEAAGDALRVAFLAPDPAARAERLADVAEGAGEAAVIARLGQAGALLEQGDQSGAAAVLAGVAGDGAVPTLYRDLAALQRVAILGPAMDRAERLATLETLSAPEAPFRPLALEQRALVHLEAGETELALADLQAVLTEPRAPEELRRRVRQLIIAAGGSLPAEGEAAALPADG